jgi:endonuclease I
MARKKTNTYTRATIRKIQQVKRKQTYRLIVLFAVFIVAFIIFYFIDDEEPYIPEYSADQNELGFYYYSYVSSEDYYYQANDLIGTDLKNQLNVLMNVNVTLKTYDEVRYILEQTDLSIEDPTQVWNIYDGQLVPATWDGGITWNREHVWPNSRLGMDRVLPYQRNQATDLHNLRAATPSVNSSRSDRFYADGRGSNTITANGGYFPGNDHKGDVARIILYMAVMYKDILTLTNDLELLLDESDHYTLSGARMGLLNHLLDWHKEDPVDAFERQRNEVIFSHQNNRNPFIDKPEYVHLIWENRTIEELLKPENNDITLFQYQLNRSLLGRLSF